ncbi:prepilin-type N-terminal cleavage/methylation domain-containing protein [Pseudomonas sp. Marseille-Q5115]|uniref:prepilin-type N-terminal cleavage/methylation domain-containing protein n=1 Tax=Pseudomonas sp. Marseille-Q5115 TaxID=2866593 RepID=UPI001CE3D8F3|nr:prepilin-type N-terminal cleavage/methylation domain-containing protein [Pseudomonas sp. Marseille-Q5115]
MNGVRQRGFTLLEVLAALALLAVTFFVVMGGIGQATHALFKDQRATRLALAAHTVLDASLDRPLQPGQQQGRLEDGVAWQLNIAPVGGHARVRLFRLNLTLELGGHVERFSTLRVQGMAGRGA